MEGGVKDGDVRAVRQCRASSLDRLQSRPIMERSEFGDLGELSDDVVVEDDGLEEARTAVDDAMADDGDVVVTDGVQRFDRPSGRLLADERKLEGGRAGVDDEDVQWGQVQSRMDGSSSPWARV
jgi:Cys-tRNA synthase (O-phospho-L-seryl-tRNA:Cys-tRNA synthase)